MKFVKGTTNQKLYIPPAALRLAGFDGDESAELHIIENAMASLKREMTASELLGAAEALHQLSVELYTHLAEACGRCGDCERCDAADGMLETLREKLSPSVFEMFVAAGICLDSLAEYIMEGDIVYGA